MARYRCWWYPASPVQACRCCCYCCCSPWCCDARDIQPDVLCVNSITMLVCSQMAAPSLLCSSLRLLWSIRFRIWYLTCSSTLCSSSSSSHRHCRKYLLPTPIHSNFTPTFSLLLFPSNYHPRLELASGTLCWCHIHTHRTDEHQDRHQQKEQDHNLRLLCHEQH